MKAKNLHARGRICGWISTFALGAIVLSTAVAQAQEPCGAATVSPDGEVLLVNKELRVGDQIQRWSIASLTTPEAPGVKRITSISGVVAALDGRLIDFAYCTPVKDTDPTLRPDSTDLLKVSCRFTDPCENTAQECAREAWGSDTVEAEFPKSFLLPRGSECSPQSSSSEGAGAPSSSTLAFNEREYLVNKAIGQDRWAVSLLLREGATNGAIVEAPVAGSVYDPAGGTPVFAFCNPESPIDLSKRGQTASFDCSVTGPCRGSLEDCSGAWASVGSRQIPVSFFLPPEGSGLESNAGCEEFTDTNYGFPVDGSCENSPPSGAQAAQQTTCEVGADCSGTFKGCGVQVAGEQELRNGICFCIVPLDAIPEECRDCQAQGLKIGDLCKLETTNGTGAVGECQPVRAGSDRSLCEPPSKADDLLCKKTSDCGGELCCRDDETDDCDGDGGGIDCDGICVEGSGGACAKYEENLLCSNGSLDAGEECDEGSDNSDAPNAGCRESCELPGCGDGIVDDSLNEECDGTPNCSKTCQLQLCGNGVVEAGEACDGGACCSDTCELTSGNVCREAAGECDFAETCNGASAECPGDFKRVDGLPCSDDGSVCTADVCSAGECVHPAGNAGSICRPSSGECDVADVCDGTSSVCPADAARADGTACADDGEACTADVCDDGACSHPAGNAGVTCRASAGECDVAETCDGVSTSCPTNAFAPGSQTCRVSDGTCDVTETCTGNSPSCPADLFLNEGTFCRAAAGGCDVAETCTGTSAACPEDAVLPAETVCDAGTCGVCDGESTSCEPGEGATTPFQFSASNGASWVVQEDDEIRIAFEDSQNCGGANAQTQFGSASKVECFAAPTCLRFELSGVVERQASGFEAILISVDDEQVYERQSVGEGLACSAFASISDSAQVLVEAGTHEISVLASTNDGAYHVGAFWEVGIERLAASACD
jgi:hypothetical protein